MSYGIVGLVLGALLGVISYVVLKKVATRTELPESKRVLNIVGLADLVLLPVLGYVLGTYVIG